MIFLKEFIRVSLRFCKSAADNYVKMVADIKEMSATTFLQELYDLFHANWKYKNKKRHASELGSKK
jgi:hypothetical protein